MTASARSTKPAPSRLPTPEDVEKGIVTLDEYEVAHGEDIPEWTEEDFARARPITDFPELAGLVEAMRERSKQPREPEPQVDVSAPVAVSFDAKHLRISLADGRELVVPLTWYPDLVTATEAQRLAFTLTPTGVHWPEFDEEASVASILKTLEKIARLKRERSPDN